MTGTSLGNWSDISPLGSGPNGDLPGALDGGNVPGPTGAGKPLVSASAIAALAASPRTAVIVIAGQSYAGNMPATDPEAYGSAYTPHGAVYQLNAYDGMFYGATDALAGTSGVGGTMWTREADRLIDSGAYDSVVLVPLAVGGSSITQWTPGGVYFRKLTLAMRQLQDAGISRVTAFNWEQGVADYASLSGDAWLSYLNQIVGTLRSHGMTAPVFTNINSVPYGTDTPPVGNQVSLAAGQAFAATSEFQNGMFAGVNFNTFPGHDFSPDGHFTSRGLDDAALQWFAYQQGPAQVIATHAGLAARWAGGTIAVAGLTGNTLAPVGMPTNFDHTFRMSGSTGDGLVFQNANGLTEIQLVGPSGAVGGGALANQIGAGWDVRATGDFNGDGHSDIVYQNAGSAPVVQLLSGASCLGGGYPSVYTFGSDWRVVGTGDFNRDSYADLVLRSGNLTAIQEQVGLAEIGGGLVSINPFDSSWDLLGVGDFRGLGHASDLVFEQASTGHVEVQMVDGVTSVGGGDLIGNPFDNNFRCVAVRGNELIYQRQTDGLLEHVAISGTTVIGGGEYAVGNSGSFVTNALFGNHQFV